MHAYYFRSHVLLVARYFLDACKYELECNIKCICLVEVYACKGLFSEKQVLTYGRWFRLRAELQLLLHLQLG